MTTSRPSRALEDLLNEVAEYAQLQLGSDVLPALKQLLPGLLAGVRSLPNNPFDGVEPAVTMHMPEVSIPTVAPPASTSSEPVTNEEFPYLSLYEARRRILARELSPVELTRALLERIDQVNPHINAYVTVLHEAALEEARKAEHAIMHGQESSQLHGIPIALKDLVETPGVRTTASSEVLKEYVPQRSATVAEHLKRAGTILLGKTHTHEFAYGVVTPTTRNPWNTGHIPGGSSGGSAAAMAAGLALGVIGTDTGGSIRIPSAFCGTVGLKPTYGRVSRFGVLPLSWSLDHVGPIARSVQDAALLYQAIAGYDRQDPASSMVAVNDVRASLNAGLKGLKVGIPRPYFYDRLQPEVSASLEEAIKTMAALGAEVQEVEIPGIEESSLLDLIIVLAEASSYHQEWTRSKGELYQPDVRLLLQGGELILATDYLHAQRRRAQVQANTLEVLERVDLLLVPTEPCLAPAVGQALVEYADGQEDVITTAIRFTTPGNVTGLPALSIPCGFGSGLPIGMQLLGRPFDEATVLRAGYAYEQATDWHKQHPKL